jgi:triphosphoribosyl-dephospho-CoA synthase
MTVAQFEASAAVSAPLLTDARLGVGERILAAVEATRAAVGCNTNLGILLLAAPLLRAAEIDAPDAGDLRARLRRGLAGLDREDTECVFRAIRLAAPGGLGSSDAHDVAGPATAGLVEVMRCAAGGDRIAFQYAHDFVDVFDTGLPAFEQALAHWQDKRRASGYSYLVFLARFPDTHVLRKLGPTTAEDVRRLGEHLRNRLANSAGPDETVTELLDADRMLKARGINPGTSADLTVATLLAKRLQSMLSTRRKTSHG